MTDGDETGERSSETIHAANEEKIATLGDSEEYPYEISSDDEFVDEYFQMPIKPEKGVTHGADPQIAAHHANSSSTTDTTPNVPTANMSTDTRPSTSNTTAYFAPIQPEASAASTTDNNNTNEATAERDSLRNGGFGQIQPTIPGLSSLNHTKLSHLSQYTAEERISMDGLRVQRGSATIPLFSRGDAYAQALRDAERAAAGLDER